MSKTIILDHTDPFTIYRKGVFGFGKGETGKNLLVEQGKYAQYDNAWHVRFIHTGKRKPTGFVEGYRATFFVLPGVKHSLDQDHMRSTGPGTSMTRWSSFDDNWQKEFIGMYTKYITENNITPLIAVIDNVLQGPKPTQPLSDDELWAAMEVQFRGKNEWTPTTREMFNQMLNCLPPAAYFGGGFLVGECWDCRGDKDYYAAFVKRGEKYFARYLTIEEATGGVRKVAVDADE